MSDMYLNVYDLPEQTATNNALSSVGLGLYHSGVECGGAEYSFSAHGVSRTAPCLSEFGVLRERLLMGSYQGTKSDFENILNALRSGEFGPGQYDLVHRNCNHFSDALCMATIGEKIPPWVNRASSIGQNFVPSSNKTTDSTATAFAAPGVVATPSLKGFGSAQPIAPGPSVSNATPATGQKQSSSVGSFFSSLFGFCSTSSGSHTTRTSSTAVASKSDNKNSNSSAGGKKAAKPAARKELTEKQKELLSKLKK